MSRKLAQVCRCQLLIGSFEGSNFACDCSAPNYCKITKEIREQLKTHPKVLAAQQRNRAEYDAQDSI